LHYTLSPTKTLWGLRSVGPKHQTPEDVIMIDWLMQLVREASPKKSNAEIKKILKEVQQIKDSGKFLTVGKVREVYRRLIASQLDGIRKVASISRENDRLVYDEGAKVFRVSNAYFSAFRSAKQKENRKAWTNYYDSIIKEWGKARVTRVLKRYKLSYPILLRKGTPLFAQHVNAITLGLADFNVQDLKNTFNLIKDICNEHANLGSLPDFAQRKLKIMFQTTDREAIVKALKEKFGADLQIPFNNLPKAISNLLRKITHVEKKELELAFQGQRIEGVVKNHPDPLIHMFVNDLTYKDQERLQLYQKLFHLPKYLPDQFEDAFREILAKSMVKKDMEKGMLIPFYTEKKIHWYRIENKTMTGRAKLFYHLVQASANDSVKLPDIFLLRNSATSPSYADSFTSLVTDGYPFAPPGYLWKRAGDSQEKNILHSRTDRPLWIIGHSLGGGLAQLAITNRLRHKGKPVNELPERTVKVFCYDTTSIRKKECDLFNNWVNQNPEKAKNIHFHYYFSRGDLFPGSGEYHLGHGVDKNKLGGMSTKILSRSNPNNPVMQLHPHERIYYTTRKNVDFKERIITIEQYNGQRWRKYMEIFRVAVGCIVAPIAWTLGITKRFFFGWRGDPSSPFLRLIRRIFNKINTPRAKQHVTHFSTAI